MQKRSETQLPGQTRLQVPEALWRSPARLRESRRAALVALVWGGWGNGWSRVSHMHIILAQGILSFLVFKKSSSRHCEIKVFDNWRVGQQVEIRVQIGIGGFVGPSASPSGRLGGCLGLLRAPRVPRWGLKGAHINRFRYSGSDLNDPRGPKEPPRSPQEHHIGCLLYTSPSPRDRTRSRMPSSA